MLKTLGRTLIILMAAGLIGLGWYAFATTTADQSTASDRSAQIAQDGEEGEEGEGRKPPSEGEDGGSSLIQLFSGMGVIVGQTTVAIIVVALTKMLIHWLKPRFSKKHKTQSSVRSPAHPS